MVEQTISLFVRCWIVPSIFQNQSYIGWLVHKYVFPFCSCLFHSVACFLCWAEEFQLNTSSQYWCWDSGLGCCLGAHCPLLDAWFQSWLHLWFQLPDHAHSGRTGSRWGLQYSGSRFPHGSSYQGLVLGFSLSQWSWCGNLGREWADSLSPALFQSIYQVNF